MSKKLYLCNGKVETCKKTNCYINGGPCRHTTKKEYRKYRYFNEFNEFGVEVERE